MAKKVSVNGSLSITDASSCSSSEGSTTKPLELGGAACNGEHYYQAGSCQCKIFQTSGSFVDVDCADSLTLIEFLYIKSSVPIILRLYALPATALGVGGSFPTGFSGGETLTTVIDGTSVVTTFDSADQTAAQVAARINAAMAFNGITSQVVTVVGGQLFFTGIETIYDGTNGTITFSGATTTTLGLDNPTLVNAKGIDVSITGLFMSQFPSSATATIDTLTKIKIAADATVEIIAHGQSS